MQQPSVGESTLDIISEADAFNAWMYRTIRPYCSGEVLEIGCGIGNLSQFFLRDGFSLLATDINEAYCHRLQAILGKKPSLLGVAVMDLTDSDFDQKFQHYFNRFDTVVALNVVEHIRNDREALSNCHKLLKKGGRLVILVPSYQKLYNQLDAALGHHRRYTKKSLSNVFVAAGFQVIKRHHFNFMGILGWFVSGRLQQNDSIPKGQMGLYNRLVPVFRIIDRLVFRQWGLSTIVVGKKV